MRKYEYIFHGECTACHTKISRTACFQATDERPDVRGLVCPICGKKALSFTRIVRRVKDSTGKRLIFNKEVV
jgi:hypothetical protein